MTNHASVMLDTVEKEEIEVTSQKQREQDSQILAARAAQVQRGGARAAVLGVNDGGAVPGKGQRRNREREKVQREIKSLPQQELARLIQTLEEEMHEAAAALKFEYAARLRDEINEMRRELRDAR